MATHKKVTKRYRLARIDAPGYANCSFRVRLCIVCTVQYHCGLCGGHGYAIHTEDQWVQCEGDGLGRGR
eukprot:2066413-Rhodomonas_salina.1